MLIDTDVLIWYLRGNNKAAKIIEGHQGFFISVVNYMELVQGIRNKQELTELRKALRVWKTQMLYINEEISAKAMFFIERYYLSHSLEMADALIAATALVNGVSILTANHKHYSVIKELDLAVFRP